MDVVRLNIEFLAIDLLGKSLTDNDDEFVQEYSIQEVAKIGIQMVHWFVNDIFHLFQIFKPQNMLSCGDTDFSHLHNDVILPMVLDPTLISDNK